MNDDFEEKLRAFTRATGRPDPTPAWKADILSRARREAGAIPVPRMLPPRPLMFAWAAAWAAIALLSFTMPRITYQSPASDLAASRADQQPQPSSGLTAASTSLLALDRQNNLNGNLQ